MKVYLLWPCEVFPTIFSQFFINFLKKIVIIILYIDFLTTVRLHHAVWSILLLKKGSVYYSFWYLKNLFTYLSVYLLWLKLYWGLGRDHTRAAGPVYEASTGLQSNDGWSGPSCIGQGSSWVSQSRNNTEQKDSVVGFSVGRIIWGWGRLVETITKALKGLDENGFRRQKRGPEMHLGNC